MLVAVEKRIDDLADDNFRQIFGRLSLIDLLHCERVSRRFNTKVWELGWKQQRQLDRDVVFEGARQEHIDRFLKNNLLDEGSCYLVSLLPRFGQNLVVLDLASFGHENLAPFAQKIADLLQLFPQLEKLNIKGLNFEDFVNVLPCTLRELIVSDEQQLSINTLVTLSRRCPELEEVPFQNIEFKYFEIVSALNVKFPRLKRLNLSYFQLPTKKQGVLACIGQLKELEKLELFNCEGFDVASLEAIVEGCRNLRLLSFGINPLTEAALFQLAKLPNLTVLIVRDLGKLFTDVVLKEIAHRGKLKKLTVNGYSSSVLTDNSIIYLVDRCKSLVSLGLFYCPKITNLSLDAVKLEVQRRHGIFPRTQPTGPLDKEVFYYSSESYSGIYSNNNWLKIDNDQREII